MFPRGAKGFLEAAPEKVSNVVCCVITLAATKSKTDQRNAKIIWDWDSHSLFTDPILSDRCLRNPTHPLQCATSKINDFQQANCHQLQNATGNN